MALFESYERRIAQINKFLNDNGIASIEEAEKITKSKGLDIIQRVRDIQPICFENACWAYLVGAAVAIKRLDWFLCDAAGGESELNTALVLKRTRQALELQKLADGYPG